MEPYDFIVLRASLQSLSKAFNLSKKLTPIFKEGLHLASPEFLNEFEKIELLDKKNKEKISRSFLKYWLRSCSRCTPYGTFAGSIVVNISEKDTKIILRDSKYHSRKVRLDMNYISLITTELEKLPIIQKQVKLFVNNSLYDTNSQFRYAEYSIIDNYRKYRLTSIEKSYYLENVLQNAKKGSTVDELIKPLIEIANVNYDEAKNFILDMWFSQILVSELEPCVTGNEPIDHLIERLEKFSDINNILNKLKNINYSLKHPVEGVDYYLKIERMLNNTLIFNNAPKNTLQTDLVLSAKENHINKNLIDSIIKQSNDILYLARISKNESLENFKVKFQNKFEDAEMPLAIVLDADLGIGYAGIYDESTGGSHWVDDLIVNDNRVSKENKFDYIHEFTLLKYHDYLKNKKTVIQINENELIDFKEKNINYNFPNSMYLMGSLMKSDNMLNSENFLFSIISFGGPSAGNLLGRFTHGDKDLCDLTMGILSNEEKQYPDAIYAEIAHLPQARVGNVLLRPVLRTYEIPYVGKSGAKSDKQIPIDDILVSIKGNEIVLRSRKLNKRIIPRLSTAHNFYYKSLPVYKFLCDLQSQGMAYPIIWDWGQLSSLKHLPRVVYKNIILKKAQWKIYERDITNLPKLTSEYIDFFKEFRKANNIPQKVVYVEADNRLLIDFEYDESIDLFLHFLKKLKVITIEEFLFTKNNCIIKDTHGSSYTDEIIIPVQNIVSEMKQLLPSKNVSIITKKFSPCSEWLFFKIYSGSTSNEKILKDYILPFIEGAIELQKFSKFFFIRYKDDHSHIRIRFFNTDLNKQIQLQIEFMQILQPLLDIELINKVSIDTYNRENERYGEDMIEDTESLFYNDSIAILRFINLLDDIENIRYKILFSLRGIDILLDDFNFLLPEKTQLLKALSLNFYNEFGSNPQLRKQINDKYRIIQKDIFSYMNPSQDTVNDIDDGISIFKIRSVMNFPIVNNIYSKLSEDQKKDKIFHLLHSYIHMFINRLFVSQHRKYELLVYHFLEKYYLSRSAINGEKMLERNSLRFKA